MSAIKIIQALGRKIAAKKAKTPEGITQIQPQIYAESEAGSIAATLQDAGIPLDKLDDFIKSEQDLVRILNLIKSRNETMSIGEARGSGIKSTKSAKIMDMEGKEIDPRSKIMGGKQAETEAEIAARISKENKESAARMKNKKMIDDAIDNASPGFSGDTKIDAELVAEDLAERMGLVYDDLPTKQRLDLYDQAYTGLSKQRFKGMKKPKDDPEDMAQGGRAGFKDGMSRRKFLQIMGGLAALPIVGKFFKAGKVATKAAPIVKTPPVAGKPEWFDSLVNKVITEGDDMTKQFATKEREIVHATKIDNDAFVTVTRDLDDGKVRVDINDPTTNVMDDQGDAIVSMEFKPGMADETTKGAKPADEFTVTETDYRNYQDGPDDFITEATENTVTDTKDLTSDLTKVKMYAKGQKKPTIKEMMIQRDRAKSLRQAEENPAEYAADRGPNIDYSDYDDFASGGIARMLGE